MHEVDWTPTAIASLADICLDHPSHWALINTAELEITSRLRLDPLKYSEHVHEGLRHIIFWPLAVFFAIEGDRVEVGSVGWIR